MNLELIDPFQKPVPDQIECTLTYQTEKNISKENVQEIHMQGEAMCCAFDKIGNYLLVGYGSGHVVVWDFYTRGVARKIESHSQAVTAVGWARDGRHIFSASLDGNVMFWDLTKIPPALKWSMNLGEDTSISSACWVSNPSFIGVVICVTTGGEALQVNLEKAEKQNFLSSKHQLEFYKENGIKNTGTKTENLIRSIVVDKKGEIIYAGNGRGRIFVLQVTNLEILYSISIQGCIYAIEQIVLSKDGNWFLAVSNDGKIRMFERHNKDGYPVQEFQDVVTRLKWQACCFSADSEHIVAGTKANFTYSLYIWTITGHLVQTLIGPKEGMFCLSWHPRRTFLAVCLLNGQVNIWSNDAITNWSAFAPDFQELEENIEYVEKEDEFDIVTEESLIVESKQNSAEEADVDVETLGKVIAFDSDSDGEVFFLYTEPLPNIQNNGDTNSNEIQINSNSDVNKAKRVQDAESILNCSADLCSEVPSTNMQITKRTKLDMQGNCL